jgi:hypothetical protein
MAGPSDGSLSSDGLFVFDGSSDKNANTLKLRNKFYVCGEDVAVKYKKRRRKFLYWEIM